MPLTPAILLGLILVLAIVAHSSASVRVVRIVALGVIVYFLAPIGAVFWNHRNTRGGGPQPEPTG